MIWRPEPGQKLDEWHDWFAWHPVELEDGRMAWWERVQRKGEQYLSSRYYHQHSWRFAYRLEEE